MGKGYLGTPGLHSDAQVAGWKTVTDAVHARGGQIVAQIMHAGRISDPSMLPGMKDHVTPRALEIGEIPDVIAEYAAATRRALDAMIAVAGAGRVGIKLSPDMAFNDIADANPQDTCRTLVSLIGPKGLAYVHVALFGGPFDYHSLLRPLVKGAYFAGGGLTQQAAAALVVSGQADAAVFGAAFIANPDLPARFRTGAALAKPDQATYYVGGDKGYTDYPALAA